MKVYRETRRSLRLIAASTDEHMVDVLARLSSAEAARLGLPAEPAPRSELVTTRDNARTAHDDAL